MSKPLKVYVAGAYSVPEPVANVATACRFGNWLIDAGYDVFVPHLNMLLHLMQPRTWDKWLEIDMRWLRSCDCLVRLPGESKGADLEVAHAKESLIPYCELPADNEKERMRLLDWLEDLAESKAVLNG